MVNAFRFYVFKVKGFCGLASDVETQNFVSLLFNYRVESRIFGDFVDDGDFLT